MVLKKNKVYKRSPSAWNIFAHEQTSNVKAMGYAGTDVIKQLGIMWKTRNFNNGELPPLLMIKDNSGSSDTTTSEDNCSASSDKNSEYSIEDVEAELMKADKQEIKNALIMAKLPVTDIHTINVKMFARSLS